MAMSAWAQRLLEQQQKPSGQPAEVLDRLLTYEREREERMAAYRLAWQRKWDAAKALTATPEMARTLWRIVK